MNHYLVLSVKQSDTLEDIKKAYHKLAHANHPDKGGNIEKMKEINAAWTWMQAHHVQITPGQGLGGFQAQPRWSYTVTFNGDPQVIRQDAFYSPNYQSMNGQQMSQADKDAMAEYMKTIQQYMMNMQMEAQREQEVKRKQTQWFYDFFNNPPDSTGR